MQFEAHTVGALIEALAKFPVDALVEAYEGEAIGVRVEAKTGEQIGFVHTVRPVFVDGTPV